MTKYTAHAFGYYEFEELLYSTATEKGYEITCGFCTDMGVICGNYKANGKEYSFDEVGSPLIDTIAEKLGGKFAFAIAADGDQDFCDYSVIVFTT